LQGIPTKENKRKSETIQFKQEKALSTTTLQHSATDFRSLGGRTKKDGEFRRFVPGD
jgi:hypothetical protein